MRIANTSLGSQVAHELRLQIFGGALPSGQLLIEGNLSEQFEVSRGPIREALAELREDGLVTQFGRSLRVAQIDDTLIEELYELRTALETYSIERALRHQEDLSEAHTALSLMRAAALRSDTSGFSHADLAFHGTFFAAGGPVMQAHIWRVFQRVLRAVLEINPHPSGDLQGAIDKHAEILAQIETNGNWRELFADHMSDAVARIRDSQKD